MLQSSFIAKPLNIPEKLKNIKSPPKNLFYVGNKNLLTKNLIVAIVGTRKPNPYTKIFCATLARELSKYGVIISGGALGIDIIAHQNSLPNTIMVSPSSLDYIYPSANASIIKDIANQGLIISEYKEQYQPKKYSFLQRNRIIIHLSDIVIIPQADLESGSMQSAQMAIQAKKPLYVLPHRIDESLGTNALLEDNQAKGIYNIQKFLSSLNLKKHSIQDDLLEFCSQYNDFEEALMKFGDRLLEYELDGKIKRENNKIVIL
ncbi:MULTISPECIES: DNA-processing protein DprA [unclassified Helicobacter]|uniref:DNA-processing protein DprA n=1 Tax=unclassified Helicobacter TaxID=2593540 RepID=UPI000CF11B71|nr:MULTISPECIES: DNA-processing protein DprA [unclassified Helicobacter]